MEVRSQSLLTSAATVFGRKAVLVIERGVVTAFGPREELLAQQGYFARMVGEPKA